MQPANSKTVTLLLQRMADGDSSAQSELLPLLYAELHGLAAHMMRNQGAAHTLQPTALIHEAWLRLSGDAVASADNHGHFVAIAARAMRSALVDHARRKAADKRGGSRERIPLEQAAELFSERGNDVLALDDVLERLTAMDAELGRLVELRFFAGLSIEETAAILGVSVPTAVRNWRVARLWLRRELGAEDQGTV